MTQITDRQVPRVRRCNCSNRVPHYEVMLPDGRSFQVWLGAAPDKVLAGPSPYSFGDWARLPQEVAWDDLLPLLRDFDPDTSPDFVEYVKRDQNQR